MVHGVRTRLSRCEFEVFVLRNVCGQHWWPSLYLEIKAFIKYSIKHFYLLYITTHYFVEYGAPLCQKHVCSLNTCYHFKALLDVSLPVLS